MGVDILGLALGVGAGVLAEARLTFYLNAASKVELGS